MTGAFSGRHVLVLGLGRFGGGRAAASYLLRHGAEVTVADRAPADTLSEAIDQLTREADRAGAGDRLRLEPGTDSIDLDALGGPDLLVVNPAIPPGHPTFERARELRIPTTQEIDLFLDAFGRASDRPVVLITGTNGKTSITLALGEVLRHAGRRPLVGGNFGRSLLDLEDRWLDHDTAVVEVSSFQLERMDLDRSVTGTILAPITEDHLDRHGTLEAYHAAKARAAVLAERFLVHAADDPVAASFATRTDGPGVTRLTHAAERSAPRASAGTDPDAFVDDEGYLCLGDSTRLAHRDALRRLGTIQIRNLLAAALGARQLGLAPEEIGLGLALCEPVPHRLRELAPIGQVRVFDDAVATSVLATREALRTLDELPHLGPIHWVGGGAAKCGEDEIPGLADRLLSGPRPERVDLFGRTAKTFGRALRDRGVEAHEHDSVPAALDAALDASRGAACRDPGASGGGTRHVPGLLFSPAFASFDQYLNFEARARTFLDWHRRQTAD